DELMHFLRMRNIDRWSPVDIKPKVAARKAVAHFRSALESANLRIMVRKAYEDDTEVHYACIGEQQRRQTRDLAYGMLAKIVFHKLDGTLSCPHGEMREIVSLYEALCGVYTQRELVTMTKHILKGFGGVHLKAHGAL